MTPTDHLIMSLPEPTPLRARFEPKQAFISYSHKNHDFVDKLRQGLETRNVTHWFDGRDIPLGEEWWQAIRTGIERAHCFITVVSFDSLYSEVCNWEVAYARALSKRIIPVFYENVFDQQAKLNQFLDGEIPKGTPGRQANTWATPAWCSPRPDKISAAENWNHVTDKQGVRFIGTADFAASLTQLVDAIRMDLQHAQIHTRLLGRAREWENARHNNSFLLKGKELREAQDWLEHSAGKDPEPSALHRLYISTSRKVEQRVTSLRSGLFLTAAVVMSFAAWFAIQQRDRADTNARIAIFQRNEAVTQRNEAQRVSQTFAIVDKSRKSETGQNPTAPLRVGQVMWVSNEDDGTVSRFAADSGDLLGSPIQTGRMPARPLSDGKYVWVANTGENTVTRIDPAAPDKAVRLELDNSPVYLLSTGDWLWVIAGNTLSVFQRDTLVKGTAVDVGVVTRPPAFDGKYVWVIGRSSSELLRIRYNPDSPNADIIGVPINNDTSQIVIALNSVWLTDRSTANLWQFEVENPQAKHAWPSGEQLGAPNWDGKYLWTISAGTGTVVRFDPLRPESSLHIDIGDTASRLYREGRRLWVFTSNKGILSYDVDSGQALSQSDVHGELSIPATNGVQMWLSNSFDDAIIVLNLGDGSLVRTLANCKGPTEPLFDGANMWVSCRKENRLLRVPALMTYYSLDSFGSQSRPQSPVFDGQYLWVSLEASGKLVRLDPHNGSVLQEIQVAQRGEKIHPPLYDGSLIWIYSSSGKVLRIEPADEPQIDEIAVGGEPFSLKQIGQFMWLSSLNPTGPDLVIIDRQTAKVVQQYDLGLGASEPVYDERYGWVWVSTSTVGKGTLHRFDPATAKMIGGSEMPSGTVNATPLLLEDTVWVTSVFNLNSDSVSNLLTEGVPGQVNVFRRSDGAFVKAIDIGTFANRVIAGGKYLWVTQASLGLFGENEQAITAIDPTRQVKVKSWSLCQNVSIAYYDPQSNLMWFVCVNLQGDQETGDVLVIDATTLQAVQHYQGLGRSAWPARRIGNRVWIVFQETGNAAVFAADTGRLARVIGLGKSPSLPFEDDLNGFLWIANADDSTVQRVLLSAATAP